jgi:hypothetical protein
MSSYDGDDNDGCGNNGTDDGNSIYPARYGTADWTRNFLVQANL